ncbi:hypothetical protein [Sporisorium scitamineum]|uniref:Uncharacterized protein n=1 Tax=Sporisorium scitamineum TaxID=49012 RepID=A0A0F7SC42_9BASI|nr:hypothetical protein [Sporisorium scitamineum]
MALASTKLELFDAVVKAVMASGEIKLWQAEQLLAKAHAKRWVTCPLELPTAAVASNGAWEPI